MREFRSEDVAGAVAEDAVAGASQHPRKRKLPARFAVPEMSGSDIVSIEEQMHKLTKGNINKKLAEIKALLKASMRDRRRLLTVELVVSIDEYFATYPVLLNPDVAGIEFALRCPSASTTTAAAEKIELLVNRLAPLAFATVPEDGDGRNRSEFTLAMFRFLTEQTDPTFSLDDDTYTQQGIQHPPCIINCTDLPSPQFKELKAIKPADFIGDEYIPPHLHVAVSPQCGYKPFVVVSDSICIGLPPDSKPEMWVVKLMQYYFCLELRYPPCFAAVLSVVEEVVAGNTVKMHTHVQKFFNQNLKNIKDNTITDLRICRPTVCC